MGIQTTTNPLPPAALQELKAWLRIETGAEDAILFAQIRAAMDMAGRFMGQPLLATDCAEEMPITGGWQRLSVGGVLSITGAIGGDARRPRLSVARRCMGHGYRPPRQRLGARGEPGRGACSLGPRAHPLPRRIGGQLGRRAGIPSPRRHPLCRAFICHPRHGGCRTARRRHRVLASVETGEFMSGFIAALTRRADAMGQARAREWADAIAANPDNPARRADDGLGLSVTDRVEALLSRPWLNWTLTDRQRRRV